MFNYLYLQSKKIKEIKRTEEKTKQNEENKRNGPRVKEKEIHLAIIGVAIVTPLCCYIIGRFCGTKSWLLIKFAMLSVIITIYV